MAATDFNVLISSAGRRVALLRLFRAALRELGLSGRVLAADMSWTAPAFHDADEGFLVPRCTSPEFVPRMLELCKAQGVRLVVPTLDPELPVYAEHRDAFAREGVAVAVSAPGTAAIGGDKVQTHEWLVANGLPTVRQTTIAEALAAPTEWPLPLILKPRRGSASIGIRRATTQLELARAVEEDPELLAQTIAPGVEHTVDVFVDRAGLPLCAVPRRRLEVRAGEVSKGVALRIPALEELAMRVCRTLPGAYGVLNVQIFLEPETGAMNIIEINPRFGGGFPLACEAGANYPRWLIEEIVGLPSSARAEAWQSGLVMLRFDDAVFVSAEQAGLSER